MVPRGQKGSLVSPATLVCEDATQIFIPGPVLADDNEFGTLISASVVEDFVRQLRVSTVSIRILPIGHRHANALRDVTTRISETIKTPDVLRYIGVWEVSPSETWLVSERRRCISVQNLLSNVHSHDVESIIAYVAQRCFKALHILHTEFSQPHTNLRPGNIYLCEDGSICFGDVGIYHVLSEPLRSRRSLPGVKIWPFPNENHASRNQADFWDLGIAVLLLVEGGASVARMWRSGRRTPRLSNPSRWSAQFNSFLSITFTLSNDKLQGASELLKHQFLSDASSTACQSAMAEYLASREEPIPGQYMNDTISTLFRQNSAVVQAPLINIDDIATDQFTYDQWQGGHQSRPTAELSILRMVRTSKEQPLPRDVEESKSLSQTIGTLETFLETADMM